MKDFIQAVEDFCRQFIDESRRMGDFDRKHAQA